MVLSESDFGHQALSDIVPLRDLFGLLFFTSVGMLFDPAFLSSHLRGVLFLVLVLSLGKGLIFASIARLFRYRNVIPLAVALGLFQIGEFSFVLARLGLSSGSIRPEIYHTMLTVAILTMILTPLVSGQTARLYAWRKRRFRHEPLERCHLPAEGNHGHLLIAGGGRVGIQIARILHRLGHPAVIIEFDHRRFEQIRDEGLSCVFGDATQAIVLEAADWDRAAQLVITIPDPASVQGIINQANKIPEKIEIIVRCSSAEPLDELQDAGITHAVVPEHEASLEIIRHVLLRRSLPPTEVQKHTENVRQELYASLYRGGEPYRMLAQLRCAEQQFPLHWSELAPNSPLAGQSIADSQLRRLTGVSVVGISRDGILHANPSADFRFRPGDIVAVIGNETSVSAFLRFAHRDSPRD